MIRRPPISTLMETLFPYTSLFRSWAYEDYQVLVAGDRAQAVEILRAEEPDVVTLDLGLPPDPDGTAEGFATLEEILALKPDTKVIVASGHGARESALRAISSGAYDFYQKPPDIDAPGLDRKSGKECVSTGRSR